MKPLRDPEQAELKHLLAACEMTGKAILDIGCGDGDFTRQYTHLTRRTVGIEPLASELMIARKKARSGRTFFLQGKGQYLPFSDQAFDFVLFTCSL